MYRWSSQIYIFSITGGLWGTSPSVFLEPPWKYVERGSQIWGQDADIGRCTLCLWKSRLSTLNTITTQTWRSVTGGLDLGKRPAHLLHAGTRKTYPDNIYGTDDLWKSRSCEKVTVVWGQFFLLETPTKLSYFLPLEKNEERGRKRPGMLRWWNSWQWEGISKSGRNMLFRNIPTMFCLILSLSI